MKLLKLFLILVLFFSGPAAAGPVIKPDLTPVKPIASESTHYWTQFHQEVWFRLGVSYLFKEKYLESFNSFSLAISYNPMSVESYQNLAFVAFKMGDFKEAALALSKSIELNPNNAEAHHLLGIIYTIYAMYDFAIEELETASRINPQDPLIRYDLGFAQEFGGYYVLAQQSYKAALSMNPEFVEAKHRLGVVEVKVLRHQELLEKEGMVRRGK